MSQENYKISEKNFLSVSFLKAKKVYQLYTALPYMFTSKSKSKLDQLWGSKSVSKFNWLGSATLVETIISLQSDYLKYCDYIQYTFQYPFQLHNSPSSKRLEDKNFLNLHADNCLNIQLFLKGRTHIS